MNVTVARRQHIHLPVKSIGIFLAAAAVAAVALVLVNQPWETESATQSTTTATTSVQAVAVPAPESLSMLRAHPELIQAASQATTKTEVVPRRNLVIGTTLSGESAYVSQPPAPWYAPGTVDNAYPLNFVAGSSR